MSTGPPTQESIEPVIEQMAPIISESELGRAPGDQPGALVCVADWKAFVQGDSGDAEHVMLIQRSFGEECAFLKDETLAQLTGLLESGGPIDEAPLRDGRHCSGLVFHDIAIVVAGLAEGRNMTVCKSIAAKIERRIKRHTGSREPAHV